MKTVFNGKIYNTDTATTICAEDRSYNGIISGCSRIMQTKNGALFCYETSNGQDLHRTTYIKPLEKSEVAAEIEGWDLSDDELNTLSELGIISEA